METANLEEGTRFTPPLAGPALADIQPVSRFGGDARQS